MPILALAIVAILAWLVLKRGPVHPSVRTAGLAFSIACAAAVALRTGPVGSAIFVTAAVAFGVWWGRRGRGGDDGDDGPDRPEPRDPNPSPGKRAELPAEVLDPGAFDRARAEWERELPKRG